MPVEFSIESGRGRTVLPAERRWSHLEDCPQILEDEDCRLRLRSPREYGFPRLAIQGYDLPEPDSSRPDGAVMVWEWRPQQYLHNAFGLTAFRVKFTHGPTREFAPVEVLAQKMRAEQAARMLDYLYLRSPALLYACFARTSMPGDWGTDSPSVERVLQAAELALEALERLLFSAMRRVRTRLVGSYVVREPGPSDVLDDRSVHYLFNHLDEGELSASDRGVALPVRGRMLHFDRVQVLEKAESTNVYENGVIHGLLLSMESRLASVQRYLQRVMDSVGADDRSSGPGIGYARFQAVCRNFVFRVSQYPLSRVEGLLVRVRESRRRADSVIPARPVLQPPRPTPFFTANSHYRPIFSAAYKWYQMGDGLSDPTDILLGLKTLDRLYEYVGLFKLLETFTAEGWQVSESVRKGGQDPAEEPIADFYRLNHSMLGEMELWYEGRIFPARVGDPLWGMVKVAGDDSPDFPYRPDFLFRVTDPQGRETVRAVLDAKFAGLNTIRSNHLADLSLKYLHGIRLMQDPARTPFDHLWLLGPIPHELFNYHWHYRGTIPIRPTIGIVQVLPEDEARGLRQWYRTILLPQMTYGRQP